VFVARRPIILHDLNSVFSNLNKDYIFFTMNIFDFFFARAGGIRQGVDILWTRQDLTGRCGTTRDFYETGRDFYLQSRTGRA
jgi:hypothetical protein